VGLDTHGLTDTRLDSSLNPSFRKDPVTEVRGNKVVGHTLFAADRLGLARKKDIRLIRKAFVLAVNPGAEEEYSRRHNPIWPELGDVLKAHGASNYSIYLHPETQQLFGTVEVESEERWNAIAQTEVCRRWWAYMKDLMPSNPDNSPVSLMLTEVFHLD
jgi:L-rhamnose mutarotase